MNRSFRFVWMTLFAVLVGTTALGQGFSFGGGAEKVDFAAEFAPADARLGETVELSVKATVEAGWHIYSMTPHEGDVGPIPTSIALDAPTSLVPLGDFQEPPPHVKFDEAFGIDIGQFEGAVTFARSYRVANDATLGNLTVTPVVKFMVCSDRVCLPPTTVETSAALTISAGVARPEFAPKAPVAEPVVEVGQDEPTPTLNTTDSDLSSTDGKTTSALNAARSQGFWAYIGFAVSMGFLALLTPCVFPMIPITVSFFTKKEGLSRTQGLIQALVYSGGIILTFTGLGIVLALLFGAAAIQGVAANVWINLLIATIFIVFALNLFGAFEIQVPYQLLGFLGGKSGEGSGTVGTILMGLTFSLTSFTCTVPFVGTVLVAATQGELMWAILGMLAFSSAFASPFFFLALFPQLLTTLPKSGGWLNAVKVTMGFLELAAALKFLSNIDLVMGWGVFPRELFLAAWVAIALLAGYYLLGKLLLPHDTPVERLGVGRLMFSVLFFSIGFYLVTGLFGKPLGELDAFLPPYSMSDGIAVAESASSPNNVHTEWLQNYDDALIAAKRDDKPIFIDFTGVTCTNCRWMEKNIFNRSPIAETFLEYVPVQLWTDLPKPESRAYQQMQAERFGTVALPFYALMTPDDKVIATFDGLTRNPDEFLWFLKEGLASYEALAQAR
ncbi:MAG: protein-disulfide reductase DsbD family protein [Candidatus Poribacteria bacterium]|nr:protein-disulfide reductase DsbD family protein [Candidatus Poribacteria bacterium]